MVVLGYDEIIVSPASVRECSYCLTDAQVEAILAVCETMAFVTRWYSATDAVIDQDTVEAFRDDLYWRLMNGCCADNVLTQFDGEGNYQTSYDGGATWVDTPNNDPRNGIIYPVPLVGANGTDKKCLAANAIAGYYKTWAENIAKAKDADAKWSDLAAVFIGLLVALGFIAVGWIFALLGGLIALIYANYTATQWRDSFDDDFWQLLVNDVFCNIGDDGQFTEEGFGLLMVDLEADMSSGIAKDYILEFFRSVRVGGLNSTARQVGYATDFDCSCGGCDLYNWDVLTGFGDIFGVITDRNPATGEITIETTGINTNNQYYIDMSISQNHDASLGCYCNTNVVGSYAEAGEAWSGSFGHSGSMLNHCVNHIQMNDAAPFSVTFTFSECP